MSGPVPGQRLGARELGKFLEIQNLGLNLPFALGFLLLAAKGLPPWWVLALVLVAFVAARNAGHSFNRWADRALDAQNPRTRARAMVVGRASPAFALGLTLLSSAILVLAAALLNPLALLLAPVALGAIFLYSYTKRVTTLTTAYLGFVEGITPAAVFIAVTGALPVAALVATGALLAWGTAFETIHSLGDIDADRAANLRSLPLRLGVARSVRLLPFLHGAGVFLLGFVGLLLHLSIAYYLALVGMATIAAIIDREIARDPGRVHRPFRLHFLGGGFFLLGAAVAVFISLPL